MFSLLFEAFLPNSLPNDAQRACLRVNLLGSGERPTSSISTSFLINLLSRNTPDEFWDMLINKRCGITEVPKDRWDENLYWSKGVKEAGKSVTNRGGFLKDIDRFDCQFFKISPLQAAVLDPQQRFGLEVAYEALHDARLDVASLIGSNTGVFVGAGFQENLYNIYSDVDSIDRFTIEGNTLGI